MIADELRRIAARLAPTAIARPIKLGVDGEGKVARRCREFIIRQARQPSQSPTPARFFPDL